MNAFADWLFSVLLGWTGSAANSAWNSIVNAAGGISSFFSRFWLPIVVLLILGGTVLDYAVWLARWRPYLVWRSWLTRRARRRRQERAALALEHNDMSEGTMHTIAEWVATPHEDSPVEQIGSGFAAQTSYAGPALQYQPQAEESPHVPYFQPAPAEPEGSFPYAFTPSVEPAPPVEEAIPDAAFFPWADEIDAQPYAEQPVTTPSPPVRRRRAERARGSGARQFLETLRSRVGSAEDEETMLDGLPSPVRQEDAFHQPIYPPNYRYQAQPPIDETGEQQDDGLS